MDFLLDNIEKYKHFFSVGQDYFESYETVDGIKHGFYTKMYKNKKPWIMTTYYDGLIHGPYTEWNKDGLIIAKYKYVNGKKEGTQHEWALKGIGLTYLKKEYTCKNGKLNGLYRRWYPNGYLHMEIFYEDGKSVSYYGHH
jgi:antitoxin component YwqK of YwqJK toxin-antitoxin module